MNWWAIVVCPFGTKGPMDYILTIANIAEKPKFVKQVMRFVVSHQLLVDYKPSHTGGIFFVVKYSAGMKKDCVRGFILNDIFSIRNL
jgi:hypothetical protein